MPRRWGAVVLDRLTADLPLDSFLLFSSLAAFGLNGGADYAYASAFLNSFARVRDRGVTAGRRNGMTVSLAWGAWTVDRYMASNRTTTLDRAGLGALTGEAGVELMTRCPAASSPVVALMAVSDRRKAAAAYRFATNDAPLPHALVRHAVAVGEMVRDVFGTWDPVPLAASLSGVDLDTLDATLIDRVEGLIEGDVLSPSAQDPRDLDSVAAVVRRAVEEVLQLQGIESHLPFQQYGVDSARRDPNRHAPAGPPRPETPWLLADRTSDRRRDDRGDRSRHVAGRGAGTRPPRARCTQGGLRTLFSTDNVIHDRAQIVFMFSGQGSQYPGMGRALFNRNRVFRDAMEQLDAIAQRDTGISIVSALYASPGDPLDDTRITHPAIFMVEHALARVVTADGVTPDVVLGASLGEIAAAVEAKMLRLEDALGFVIAQAQLFEEHCPPGRMMVVLDSPEAHEATVDESGCEIAAVNGPRHFVVAGPAEAIARCSERLRSRGIVVDTLPVTRAFHCSAIEAARRPFLDLAAMLTMSRGAVPFVSCTSADFAQPSDTVHFWDVVRQPLRVRDTLTRLLQSSDATLIDLGPFRNDGEPGDCQHGRAAPTSYPLRVASGGR